MPDPVPPQPSGTQLVSNNYTVQLQASYEQQYGPGDYVPNVFVQYWSMRVMAYLATGIVLLSLWGAWLLYRRRLETSKWFLRTAVWAVFTPLVGVSFVAGSVTLIGITP